MKNICRRLMNMLLCLLGIALLPLSACTGGAGAIVRYDISTAMKSLDPQYASSEDAKLIVRNAFEGLYTPGEDGTPVPAAARDLSFSGDGLTATIRLRDGLVWSDGDGLTTDLSAADFAFALQRLFTPDFPSPFASDFICIKNAEAILRGELPPSSLGVSAPDAHTLILSLEYPTESLPQLLCSTAAMPCPKAFFEETRGRYGLDRGKLLYNGPFYVRYWEQSYVQLRRNNEYYDAASVAPDRVMLEIISGTAPAQAKDSASPGDAAKEPTTHFSRFQKRKTDAAVLSYDEWSRLEGDRWTSARFEDTVWALVFNQRDPFLADTQARSALARAIDHRAYAPTLGNDLVDTNVFLPPSLRLGDESYRNMAGFTGPDLYATDQARAAYADALTRVERPEPFVLLAANDSTHPFTAGAIQKMWRQTLSLNATVRMIPHEELTDAVQSGNYQAAIVPMRPDSQQPGNMLGDFGSASSRNFAGYRSAAYDSLLGEGASAHTAGQQLLAYRAAESLLYSDAVVVPLYFQTHYYVMAPGVDGVRFSPFAGETNFKYVTKR